MDGPTFANPKARPTEKPARDRSAAAKKAYETAKERYGTEFLAKFHKQGGKTGDYPRGFARNRSRALSASRKGNEAKAAKRSAEQQP